MKLEVLFTPHALEQLRALKEKAEAAPSSLEAVVYRRIRDLVRDVLPEPVHALAKANALEKRGNQDFRKVFREKMGRRGRMFYIVSTKHAKAIVLFFGYRKEGDSNDAYEELSRRLKSKEFAPYFEQLEVKMPKG